MKPQRFEIGQAVTVIDNDPWDGDADTIDPKFGEVYHVSEYKYFDFHINEWIISFYEIPNSGYSECSFAPVTSTEQLVEELESIPEWISQD